MAQHAVQEVADHRLVHCIGRGKRVGSNIHVVTCHMLKGGFYNYCSLLSFSL